MKREVFPPLVGRRFKMIFFLSTSKGQQRPAFTAVHLWAMTIKKGPLLSTTKTAARNKEPKFSRHTS